MSKHIKTMHSKVTIFMLKTCVLSALILLGCISSNEAAGPNDYAIKTIVIDAGHGGHDPGCLGASSREKHIALSIALKMGQYIEESFPEIKVVYTRKTDVFIPLHERAEIANKSNADLFISIHCNANNNKDVSGTETYVMGLHRSEQNLLVAKRENEVILLEDDYNTHYDGFDPNSPEGHIIFSLYQNAHLEQSILLASKIEKQFKERAMRHSRGVKQAGFLVLYKTTMPSVLVESGFLTNVKEEKYLHSDDGQAYIASAIYRAFKEFKQEIEGNAKTDTPAEASLSPSINIESDPVDEIPVPAEKPVAAPVPAVKDTVFRVQVFATSKKLKETDPFLAKLNEFSVETTPAGIHKYLTGQYYNLAEALKYQAQLQKSGYKDAFVVAYKHGKRIPFK